MYIYVYICTSIWKTVMHGDVLSIREQSGFKQSVLQSHGTNGNIHKI